MMRAIRRYLGRSKRLLLPTLALLTIIGWATPTLAQQILAAIVTADLPRYNQAHQALATVLKNGGFGKEKLKLFVQRPNADKMSLINSLRRAESAGASLIVTYGSQATLIAQGELKNTPLLFTDVYDPVALGTVKTLAAPGTNASGATSKTDPARLVDALLAIKPVKSVGLLYTKGEKGSEQQLGELQALAKANGFTLTAKNVRNPSEAAKIAAELAKTNEALYVSESIAAVKAAAKIIAAADQASCIVCSQVPGLTAQGALLGLEADPDEQGKLAAVHALQTLQGQQLLLLPVRAAKKISLTVNAATAQKLGLTVPAKLASTAKML